MGKMLLIISEMKEILGLNSMELPSLKLSRVFVLKKLIEEPATELLPFLPVTFNPEPLPLHNNGMP